MRPNSPAQTTSVSSSKPRDFRSFDGASVSISYETLRTIRAVEARQESLAELAELDDAIIALYQNGEPLMPGNGFPMRLLLPGYEGNMNVKYLRRIKLLDRPEMSFYESKVYTAPLPSGKAYRFYFVNEVKSFITSPSPGRPLQEPGLYEISGIAYSGKGSISKVLVSADGGLSWAEAALQQPVLVVPQLGAADVLSGRRDLIVVADRFQRALKQVSGH